VLEHEHTSTRARTQLSQHSCRMLKLLPSVRYKGSRRNALSLLLSLSHTHTHTYTHAYALARSLSLSSFPPLLDFLSLPCPLTVSLHPFPSLPSSHLFPFSVHLAQSLLLFLFLPVSLTRSPFLYPCALPWQLPCSVECAAAAASVVGHSSYAVC